MNNKSLTNAKKSTSTRGFASMSKEKQLEIASMGGKAVPDHKRSFSQDRKLAANAGKKGGAAKKSEDRSFSQDRELAREAGIKGNLQAAKNKREAEDKNA